jgi:broad specificity phosphatase PhoE
MRLILARHGQTQWNLERRVQGVSDIELNDLGRRQAEALSLRLTKEPLAACYSSPLQRARATAEAIAAPHNLKVTTDERLMEMDQGDLEGMKGEDMRRDYGELLKGWTDDPSNLRIPGGETLVELQERAWAAVADLLNTHQQDKTVLVVSHSFTIRTIICKAIGLELKHFRSLGQELAAVNTLSFGERGAVLSALNDTCHLRDKD